jgi:hypothetical protein
MQLLAAARALVGDLQEGAEHAALAAGRTAPAKSPPQRLGGRGRQPSLCRFSRVNFLRRHQKSSIKK